MFWDLKKKNATEGRVSVKMGGKETEKLDLNGPCHSQSNFAFDLMGNSDPVIVRLSKRCDMILWLCHTVE